MKKYKTLVALQILFIFNSLNHSAHSKSRLVARGSIEDKLLEEAVEGKINLVADQAKSGADWGSNGVGTNPLQKTANVMTQNESIDKKLRVVIDPGHGGKDVGARGFHGVKEKEICLRVSHLIRREIERYSKLQGIPVEVKLSREFDEFIPLKERARQANVWGADLFVSIHANSSPASRARGFEVYFLSPEATDEEASKLARLENQAPPTPINAQVISILSDATTQYHVAESSQLAESMFSAVSQRIVSNGRAVRQAPFTVLHGTNMPAVLVEIGYVTNFEEAKNLSKDTYLKKIANAISSGIVDFVNRKRK